ncbi:uncharacterized protein LOC121738306 [Aricia agestis]|uniref:uncharacterized protein LOC121738306 n=2 Tax=Aricia agestis TaxID=91739 RepID=UPI001C2019D5|nr:uncharacterized protein LOC121738306 [Aricia agestis]
MDYIASEKGDTTENRDPNSLVSNGNSKPVIDEKSSENDDKPHIEAPTENAACTSEKTDISEIPEQVEFTVVFNNNKHDITFAYDASVVELKAHLERICAVPQSAQKLIIKGMARDSGTIRQAGIVKGGKVMLVGYKMDDILAVKSAPKEIFEEKSSSQSSKEPLCMQKNHSKVLDKGIPPDVMPGIKGVKEPLPPVPLSGMLNKHGGKVRLTFKPEQDQLWLGTKERTEKLAMTSIKTSEKGDTTENRDPNSLVSNGNSKPVIDENSSENDDKPHIEAPTENAACTSEKTDISEIPEQVEFTVVFNKNKHDITFAYDASVVELKAHLEQICAVPQSAQKLIIKGMARDSGTIRQAGIVKGGKVMLVGSKMDDILAVKSAPKEIFEEKSSSQSSKEPLCMQKNHRKVLDKGIPPDVMPGIKGVKEPLPPVPLSGMLNKHGGKVRLTFKPEQDQLWLGTKERTEKLAMHSLD